MPTVLIMWLFLGFFGISRREFFLTFTTYFCLFVAVPLGILYPLYAVSYFDGFFDDAFVMIESLLGIGLGIAALGVLLWIFKFLYRSLRN